MQTLFNVVKLTFTVKPHEWAKQQLNFYVQFFNLFLDAFMFVLITYTERRWNTNERKSRVIISDVSPSFAPKSYICVFVFLCLDQSDWITTSILRQEKYTRILMSQREPAVLPVHWLQLFTENGQNRDHIFTQSLAGGRNIWKSHPTHTHHKKVNLWFLLYLRPLCTWSDKKLIAFPIFPLSVSPLRSRINQFPHWNLFGSLPAEASIETVHWTVYDIIKAALPVSLRRCFLLPADWWLQWLYNSYKTAGAAH